MTALSLSCTTNPKKHLCLDENKINQFLNRNDFEYSNFDMSTVKPALCNPEDKRYKLLDTLMFLQDTDISDTVGAVDVNGHQINIIGINPYSFLKDRIKKISFDDSKNSFCSRNDASTFGYNNYNSEIHLCPFFFSADFSERIRRAQALLHEARHADGFRHEFCRSGSKTSAHAACDSSVDFNGAYTVSLEYFLRLYRSKNAKLSHQEILDIRFYILNYANDEFNKQAIPIIQGVSFVKSNGQFIFYDKKAFKTIHHKEKDYLTSYEHLNSGPIVVNKGEIKGFLGGLEPVSFPTYDKPEANFLDMTTFMSVEGDDLTKCMLYINKISCLTFIEKKVSSSQLKIPKISYIFTADRNQSYLPYGIYMGTTDGRLYRIPDNISRLTNNYEFEISSYENVRGIVNLNDDFDIVLSAKEGNLSYYHKTNKTGRKGQLEKFILSENDFEKIFYHRYSPMIDLDP